MSERAERFAEEKILFLLSEFEVARVKTLTYVLHGLHYPTINPPPPKKTNKTKYCHINLQAKFLGLCQYDI